MGRSMVRQIGRDPLRGLTLIELLMVVSVIVVLVSMVIPIVRQAKKVGNETSTVSSLRTAAGAQENFRTRHGSYASLAELSTDGYVDTTFGAPSQRSGYDYEDQVPTSATWGVNANPIDPGVTGDRYFFIDETSVIRKSEAGVATTTDSAI